MGQTLSEPITTKSSSAQQNSKVKVGSSSMQGWRTTMEDAHTQILELNGDKETMFFGVYDGHGGAKISLHVSKHLHHHIVDQEDYKDGKIKDAIEKAFLECDESMRLIEDYKSEMSGSTAITTLIKENVLYAGNVGDSRAIASIDGQAMALSIDHKPNDPIEHQRIINAGGFVEINRVNGNLALSRAFGDFGYKGNAKLPAEEQIVSCQPDVMIKEIQDNWEFVLLACDGIWDVLSNQEVCEFVMRRIARSMEPEEICEELMTRCLSADSTMGGLGCDNMTVILVMFLRDKPYQVLADKCQKLIREIDVNRNLIDDDDDDNESTTNEETSEKNKETENSNCSSDESQQNSDDNQTDKTSEKEENKKEKDNDVQSGQNTQEKPSE